MRVAPRKHPATRRIGGPGASHENRKLPQKSKPHGEISRAEARSGNRSSRRQNKPWDEMPDIAAEQASGRVDAGGGRVKARRPSPPASRGVNPRAHTAEDDDPVKPKNRRQVR
jgi:hypothetical protein